MEAGRIISQAQDSDPKQGLRAVVALRRLASRLEAAHVQRAREQGMTWEQIARELQVSRQSVHEKYAGGKKGRDRGRSRGKES